MSARRTTRARERQTLAALVTGRVLVDEPVLDRIVERLDGVLGPMARNEDGALYDSTRTIVVTANRECRATAYAAVVEFRGSSTAASTCETMMVVFRALSAARDVRVRAIFGREQTIASFEPGIDGRF